jgi:hypothetical protein
LASITGGAEGSADRNRTSPRLAGWSLLIEMNAEGLRFNLAVPLWASTPIGAK